MEICSLCLANIGGLFQSIGGFLGDLTECLVVYGLPNCVNCIIPCYLNTIELACGVCCARVCTCTMGHCSSCLGFVAG